MTGAKPAVIDRLLLVDRMAVIDAWWMLHREEGMGAPPRSVQLVFADPGPAGGSETEAPLPGAEAASGSGRS